MSDDQVQATAHATANGPIKLGPLEIAAIAARLEDSSDSQVRPLAPRLASHAQAIEGEGDARDQVIEILRDELFRTMIAALNDHVQAQREHTKALNASAAARSNVANAITAVGNSTAGKVLGGGLLLAIIGALTRLGFDVSGWLAAAGGAP